MNEDDSLIIVVDKRNIEAVSGRAFRIFLSIFRWRLDAENNKESTDSEIENGSDRILQMWRGRNTNLKDKKFKNKPKM